MTKASFSSKFNPLIVGKDEEEPQDVTSKIIELIRDYESKNYKTPVIAITQFSDSAESNFSNLNKYDINVITYEQGADYIGCGPFRYTTTKEKLSPVLGIEGYRQIIEQMRENKISLPMVAIGGLTPDDIDPLAELGIGVAMSGTILNAENPVTMTRQIHDKCFGLFMENLNHFFENQ